MLSPTSVCLSVRPLCYLLLNHWAKFNQFWCVMGRATAIVFGSAPWGPGEGSKGQILFDFNFKVNFKDFYTKLCKCSHKGKMQNISDGIFILSPGSCPRRGILGCLVAKIKFPPAVCLLYYLFLNHWTKFNQIWCVSYSHEWGVQQQMLFCLAPWGPGEGSKGQISLNFNYKVNIKDFYTKLCVCSHKRKIQNILDMIFILLPGSCPWGGTLGSWAKNKKKSNMVMWHIKSTRMTSRTECKYNFHPRVNLVTLW